MARVTIEDCVKVVSHFKLILLAANRAKSISAGDPPQVDRDDDKNPVLALREIASEAIPVEVLEENYIKSLQRHIPVDEESDDDLEEFMNSETDWAADENMEEELEAFSQIDDAEVSLDSEESVEL